MNQHEHDHDHGQPHAEIAQTECPGHYDIMETAVRELLIEMGLFGADEIRRQIEVLDSRTPALGAKVVARAWVDPGFRAVLAEFGTQIPDDVEIRVSDSTAMVRYLVLPRRPDGTDGYSEEQLASFVTRDAMIGVIPVSIGTAGAHQ